MLMSAGADTGILDGGGGGGGGGSDMNNHNQQGRGTSPSRAGSFWGSRACAHWMIRNITWDVVNCFR